MSIESITSKDKAKGTGTCMMDFAKRVLFGDGDETSGFLFAQVRARSSLSLHPSPSSESRARVCVCAQCIKIDFWDFRLDETIQAKSLVFQMDMLYESYTFEAQCTMRARFLTNKERDTPSPMKALVD